MGSNQRLAGYLSSCMVVNTQCSKLLKCLGCLLLPMVLCTIKNLPSNSK